MASQKKVCLGCGTDKSVAQIKCENPAAASCCPERRMVHPEYAKGYDAGFQSAVLNRAGCK